MQHQLYCKIEEMHDREETAYIIQIEYAELSQAIVYLCAFHLSIKTPRDYLIQDRLFPYQEDILWIQNSVIHIF